MEKFIQAKPTARLQSLCTTLKTCQKLLRKKQGVRNARLSNPTAKKKNEKD